MGPGTDIESVLRDLGVNDAEIAVRKAYLDITEQDIGRLMEFHRRVEDSGERGFFVEAFYRHLSAFPETARFIEDPATLARLKTTQTEYFQRLTAGDYGCDYVRNRVRIGVTHEHIGLAPRWYLGAYNTYISQVVPKVQEYFGHDPDAVTETLQSLIKIIIFDMGLAIDTYIHANQRAIRRKAEQLTALNRVSVALTASLGLDRLLEEIMEQGLRLTGAKASCIAFFDQESSRFKNWVTKGLSPRFVQNMSFEPGGLADETFVMGPWILSNDRPETRHKLSRLARDEGLKCCICLPLVSHANHLGVIYFYRDDRDSFESDEIEILATFASLAAEALDRTQLHALTLEQARTDALTGLCNRREFDVRLAEEHQRARRYAKPFALLMIDLDRFKRVNDDYGHTAGDAALRSLAGIFQKQFREVDTVARYGGEEFAAILPEIEGGIAKHVAERVRRAVAATPFTLPDGREIGLSVSIGVSCYPNCADTAQEVVNRADQALYVAKQAGRNRVVLYRELLKAQIEEDPLRIVALLNESLENVQAIVTAIDTKTEYFRNHTDCTRDHAMRLGRALGLGKTDLETLESAALLHDVGIIYVPDAVLRKDLPLTDQEWDVLRRHPVAAAELLERVPALRAVVPAVRHHHERWDGRGYPDGLRGDVIPYLARVLAVADVWCALTADRPQRRAYGEREASELLAESAGRDFDPAIVRVFLSMLENRTL